MNVLTKIAELTDDLITNGRSFEDNLKRILKKGPEIIFDVGANTGQSAVKYAALFPKASIYSFEPFEDSYKKLVKKTSSLPNVIPVHLALAARNGMRDLHTWSVSANNSFYNREDRDDIKPKETVKVNARTLADFCGEREISHIDFLKIDAEGAETEVLEGAAGMLEKNMIRLVSVEAGFNDNPKHTPFSGLYTLMNKYGFLVQGFYGQVIDKRKSGALRRSDVLFLNPAFKKE